MNSTRIHTLPCRINKKQASTRRVPNWGNTIDYSLVVISFPQRWFGHLCFQIVNIALQKTTESFFFSTDYFSFCSLKSDCLWLLFFKIAYTIDSKTRKRQTLICRIRMQINCWTKKIDSRASFLIITWQAVKFKDIAIWHPIDLLFTFHLLCKVEGKIG